ncbi:glycosyltransferase [Actinoplanes sp. NPDC049681]|uniref:glycosyltransferase n=1 Tax=Actinoplanes sp. NPDC049681 TaxID=3363905 RepID=UPI003787CC0A
MSRVVIWRSGLLAPSETFVRAQAHALARWQARFLGAVKVASPLAEESDVIVFPGERRGPDAGFLRLRVTGRSPRLHRLLAGLGPDLVHAHFGGDGWMISGAATEVGVPLVVTVHGHDVTRQPYAKGIKGVRHRRNLRTVFRRAALILAVSEHIRDRAIAQGADPAKVRVHHTGVPIPPLPRTEKPWDIVFVGRFVPKKGLADLLEAAATLRDLAPRILFVGDGPLREPVRARAAQLGVDVTFAGALNHAAAGDMMAAAKVFASPSRTAPDGDTEGLPTTILEAAARGVPVVSTRHSGIPEAVVHGTTGLLSAEGDTAGLAAGLRALLTDASLRDRLGRQARAHARAGFDLVTQTRRLEELYDEVTRGAAGAVAPRVPRPRMPAPPELGPYR